MNEVKSSNIVSTNAPNGLSSLLLKDS